MSYHISMKAKRSSRGAIALSTILGITLLVSILGIGIGLIAFFEGLIGVTQARSTEAYFAAEAGVYDALRRLLLNPTTQGDGVIIAQPSYPLVVNSATSTVQVGSLSGSKVTITSIGESQGRKRKLEVEVFIDGTTGALQILSWKEVNI